ncbi:hypothetical protein LGQ02_04230 [Bacillus shivajii]|uniref:TOTE conflict system archaeo-eukaryotic primase domain-containing protein n=1 Tax=Bacillus shivajii TaxID=1983719 RepID=UPI001CF969DF|nr:hypothetical protein [Bacillus shivajii]UCZ53999.1 hypothetical protein LGQ02_04230 [Bacillus shivajii]
MNLETKLKHVLRENAHLKEENKRLKQTLNDHSIPYTVPKENARSKSAIVKQRIAIFKDLFKGRNDVFPVRWESRSGKSGYAPACDHEWDPVLCEKPNIKCSDCKNRKLTPLTDQVLFDHLSGKKTIGIYPLLKDDTCFFLAIDFDKKSWNEDVRTFIDICNTFHIPVAVERSRSGNGAHVWIFFSERTPASMARRLGNNILEKALESRYQIGMDSYDRMFPNQDSMPRGGFGNLIALPLQKVAREKGNSVFLNQEFEPYDDQWTYLSHIKKLSQKDVQRIISELSQEKSNLTRTDINLKQDTSIELLNGIKIEKDTFPSKVINDCLKLSSFSNPQFYKAQAKRLSTHRIPKKICSFDEDETSFIFPRGCYENINNFTVN